MIKKLFQKVKDNKEFRLYIIWGVISSVLNVALFRLLMLAGIEYRVSNIITLIVVRVFCYLTNKFFVFRTKTKRLVELLKEIVSFSFVRMATFLMDYFGVIFLVEILKMDALFSKVITMVVVIICNYFFSKFFVFKRSEGMNR